MFAKLTTPQRIQIGLVLAMAFLLVLGSNRLDQRHFSTIQTTVNSVYKDRVVVQDLIYQLNNIFHEKELQLVQRKEIPSDRSTNKWVHELLVDFKATKLTMKESKLLKELNGQFENLKDFENRFESSSGELSGNLVDQMVQTLDGIERTLDGLAKIQLDESWELTQASNKSLGMNILLSKLEVGFLVLIGVAMLALIFYPVPRMRAIRGEN